MAVRNVLLYGYYGFKNLGDEFLLLKIYQDVRTVLPEAQIWVWSGNPAVSRRLIGDKGVRADLAHLSSVHALTPDRCAMP